MKTARWNSGKYRIAACDVRMRQRLHSQHTYQMIVAWALAVIAQTVPNFTVYYRELG